MRKRFGKRLSGKLEIQEPAFLGRKTRSYENGPGSYGLGAAFLPNGLVYMIGGVAKAHEA